MDSVRVRRLLVVDDDVTSADALARLLRGDAYEVAVSHSAADARRLLATRSFDALVTDLEMPGESGVEVVRASQRVGTKFIFVVSAYDLSPRATEATHAGAQRVFPKPLDYEELKRALTASFPPRPRD